MRRKLFCARFHLRCMRFLFGLRGGAALGRHVAACRTEFLQVGDIKAFRAFRHEQHANGHKDQLQVVNQRAVFNIEHVELELVLKVRIVFTVDLRVARQSRFDLHAVAEFRHALAVEIDILDPLRARADQRHFAVQNVEKLRQFVDAGSAHELAERRNAAVARAGELRAVLFRVHNHAAKLIERKALEVAGVAFLPKEHRPAVLQLDDDRGQQHQRARNHDADERDDDIHQPFCRELLNGKRTVLALVNERIADDVFVRIVENDVLHRRQHEEPLVVFEAVLREFQPKIARDIAHKYR